MIVEQFLSLPPWITYQGIEFALKIIRNGSEVRLVYAILNVSRDSEHFHSYAQDGTFCNDLVVAPADPSTCTYLLLIENIYCDAELLNAFTRVRRFISLYNLMP